MKEQIYIKPNKIDKYNKMNYKQQLLDRFWNKVIFPIDLIKDCWIWFACKNSNQLKRDYGLFYVNSIIGNQRTHRFSYEYFYGLIPENNYVLHTCDNPSCVNPNHLFLGTQQDNMDDMYKKNRQNKAIGENNGKSVLTDNQVKEILNNIYYNKYTTVQQICKIYNCSEMVIHSILHRKFWKHITDNIPDDEIKKLRNKINTRNKLSEDDIRNIKQDLKNGVSIKQISQIYSIGKTMVGNIKHGRNHVNIN